MKVLHLTLKKKWFDMILSGEKKAEYREVTEYWRIRLVGKNFDAILFKNGYGKNAPQMLVELCSLSRSLGIIEWGAPENKMVYILTLGKTLKTDNLK